jgi:microsomal epoxide hydrolase
MSYSHLPHTPKIPVEPFKINHPQSELDDLRTLLKLTRIPKKTYESVSPPASKFGTSHEWISSAKGAWGEFDWRKWEDRINDLPQFKAKVGFGEEGEFEVHSMGLFSANKGARPIVFLHGWPGCFLEFLPMLEMIRQKWTAEELP